MFRTRHSSHIQYKLQQYQLTTNPSGRNTCNCNWQLARLTYTRADSLWLDNNSRTKECCVPPTGHLDFNKITEETISLLCGGCCCWCRWMQCPCSHRYLIRGASHTCHLFDVTVATGAEGHTLGAGVAVHLPIYFHGLSEWKEERKQRLYSKQSQRDSTQTKQKGLWQHAQEVPAAWQLYITKTGLQCGGFIWTC